MMMKNCLKKIAGVFLLLLALAYVHAQQSSESYVLETKYLLYLPDGYRNDTSQKWPLLIFLHGSGESGTDITKVKVHGPPKLAEQGKKFPFIIVSPQAPPKAGWKIEILKSMLDDLKKKYRVDHDRIYLTGLSMGGFGTWNFASEYPEEFAAIVPVCGGGNPAEVWKLRHMAVWCFHGAKDDVVLPSQSQKMVDELKKYNPGVRFTLYPDANHNSWDTTYSNDSLYTWLLEQRKFKYKPVPVQEPLLKEYEGAYLNHQNKDTVRVAVINGNLVVKTGREDLPLKASSQNNFYWDDNSIDEIEFVTNKQNKVDGFILRVDELVRFKKIISSQKK